MKRSSSVKSGPPRSARSNSAPAGLPPYLVQLWQQARRLEQLQDRFWPELPPDLQSHCRLANLRGTTLVLTAPTSLWAAKARHASSQILHAARSRCKIAVDRLEVLVVPEFHRETPRKRKRDLSADASKHLERAADSVEDEELKASLLRIARRGSG